MLAESLDQFRPPAANRDQDAKRVRVHVPAADEADEEHQREVEVEDADQVQRLLIGRHRDTCVRTIQIVSALQVARHDRPEGARVATSLSA